MKLKVDQRKCDTNGACVKHYPELFRFQTGSKKAEFIPESIPVQLVPAIKKIMEVCPRNAISIEL